MLIAKCKTYGQYMMKPDAGRSGFGVSRQAGESPGTTADAGNREPACAQSDQFVHVLRQARFLIGRRVLLDHTLCGHAVQLLDSGIQCDCALSLSLRRADLLHESAHLGNLGLVADGSLGVLTDSFLC